jgi:hypothetical protein
VKNATFAFDIALLDPSQDPAALFALRMSSFAGHTACRYRTDASATVISAGTAGVDGAGAADAAGTGAADASWGVLLAALAAADGSVLPVPVLALPHAASMRQDAPRTAAADRADKRMRGTVMVRPPS